MRWSAIFRALRGKQAKRGIAVSAAAAAGVSAIMITDHLVRRYEETVPRDPVTGIIRGAEPRDLGDPAAPNAVLFVHGFNGTPNNFNDLPDRVATAGWCVRAMLLPGHGTKPHDMEETTGDELRAAVLGELRALKQAHEKVVLVGHSLGGALATLTAADEPVDGLVLAAPFYRVTYKWYYLLPAERWARMMSPIMRWAPSLKEPVNRVEARDKIISYHWASSKFGATAVGVAEQARQESVLARVTCPVLLVHSRIDNVTDPKAAEEAFNQLAATDKRAVWLERSDHIIFWDYEADQVAQATLEFLDHIAAGAPAAN